MERLTRYKNQAEKERSQLRVEVTELTTQLDEAATGKLKAETAVRTMEEQLSGYKLRCDEYKSANTELNALKLKLQSEIKSNSHIIEDSENKVNQLTRCKLNLTSIVEEIKQQMEEETKVRK